MEVTARALRITSLVCSIPSFLMFFPTAGVEIAMRRMVLAVVAILIGLAHPALADDPPVSGRPFSDALPLFGTNHCGILRNLAEQLF